VISKLLVRGMLAGLIAGVAAFGFARLVGEPQIDAAIEREAVHSHEHDGQPVVVSRALQKSVGLATATIVYGVAIGGLFALAFALAHGRIATCSARATAAVLGLIGLVSIHVAPGIKYPANPPGLGDADTVARRTALYVLLLAISVVGAIAAVLARGRLARRIGGWDATVVAAIGYVALIAVCTIVFPTVQEHASMDFPAALLWRFRMASFGLQLVTWAGIALGFGALAERLYRPPA
jgi:hypothetical protein